MARLYCVAKKGIPDGRKMVRKFIEIGHVKFKKFNKLSKISWFILHGLSQKYENNWKLCSTRRFSGETPTLWKFLIVSIKLSPAPFIFSSKVVFRLPRLKLIIDYSEYKRHRGRGPRAPFEIFTEYSKYSSKC